MGSMVDRFYIPSNGIKCLGIRWDLEKQYDTILLLVFI